METTYHCIFCGKPIEPEPCEITINNKRIKGYVFECSNQYCEAIYSAQFKSIQVNIYRASSNPDINWLRNEEYISHADM